MGFNMFHAQNQQYGYSKILLLLFMSKRHVMVGVKQGPTCYMHASSVLPNHTQQLHHLHWQISRFTLFLKFIFASSFCVIWLLEAVHICFILSIFHISSEHIGDNNICLFYGLHSNLIHLNFRLSCPHASCSFEQVEVHAAPPLASLQCLPTVVAAIWRITSFRSDEAHVQRCATPVAFRKQIVLGLRWE